MGDESKRVKPRGPVVTTELYDVATYKLNQEVESKLSSEASQAAHVVTGWVTEQIRQAYLNGLRDGFAQGNFVAGEDE